MSMDALNSVTLLPDQVAALNGLVRETGAFGLDVAPDSHRSVRVVTFTARPGEDDEDTTPIVRFFTVSVAGSIREQSPATEIAA
jgi:hypothetical protein